MLEIGNRRYVGSKRQLLRVIYETVQQHIRAEKYSIADLFAGTGCVSALFSQTGKDVIINDTLYSNFVAYQTWFGTGYVDEDKLKKIILKMNNLDSDKLDENYFSKIYGGKYFSVPDAKKIGYIREEISDAQLTERERYILITCLIYAADKIANTVGHFEHFLSTPPKVKNVFMDFPAKLANNSSKTAIYMENANDLVRKISSDVVYIDPPYNARQYVNFYHVLENLARWEKPTEFEGTSMKFKRNHLKSDYSKAKAPIVMKDLINNVDAKLIIVSYNNTYSAKSIASNNKITESQLNNILTAKGDVLERKVVHHKSFNSGKTDFKDHKEFLYVCRVGC